VAPVSLGEAPSDRQQPCDVKAECCILASILEDDAIFVEVSTDLREEHFYSPQNAIIYAAMSEIAAKAERITLPAIRDILFDTGRLEKAGGDKYLEYELFISTPAVLDPYREVERVVELYRLRQMQYAAKKFLSQSYITPMEDIPGLVTQFEKDMSDWTKDVGGGEAVDLRDAILDYAKEYQKQLELNKRLETEGKSTTEMPTGIKRLDDILGGLHRGNVTVVAGRPGMGKSAFGMKLAQSVAGKLSYEGKVMASAFVSLEMPRKELVMRLACESARVSISKYRKTNFDQQEVGRFFVALNDLSKLPIQIIDRVASMQDIRSTIRRAKLRYDRDGMELSVVVIDYLQLIAAKQGKSQTRENVVQEISRGLKLMAQAENVCIVLLAQLNRDCEQARDKRPQLHNLRESGSIEQDADEVLFLLRKEYYWPDEDDVKGMCEIIVSKQRNGPTGSALAAFRAFCTRFDDLETDQEDGEGGDYFESLDKWNDIPRGSRKKR